MLSRAALAYGRECVRQEARRERRVEPPGPRRQTGRRVRPAGPAALRTDLPALLRPRISPGPHGVHDPLWRAAPGLCLSLGGAFVVVRPRLRRIRRGPDARTLPSGSRPAALPHALGPR